MAHGSLTEMLLACCSLRRCDGCLIKAALGRFGELNSYVMDFLYLPRSLQLYFLINFIENDRTLLLLLYSMGSTLNIVCMPPTIENPAQYCQLAVYEKEAGERDHLSTI